MAPHDPARVAVLACLAATTGANALFLLTDPRLLDLPPWLALAYLAGGAAYVVAIPLCRARARAGYLLAAFLGVAGFALAAADDFALVGRGPNAPTFALNLAVMAAQVPLVAYSLLWLRTPAAPT